jgi:hypothetical protein
MRLLLILTTFAFCFPVVLLANWQKDYAPELVTEGFTSRQSDIYQLGLVLFFLHTGQPAVTKRVCFLFCAARKYVCAELFAGWRCHRSCCERNRAQTSRRIEKLARRGACWYAPSNAKASLQGLQCRLVCAQVVRTTSSASRKEINSRFFVFQHTERTRSKPKHAHTEF